MHVLRWLLKNTHRNFLPDRVFLINHNKERSMVALIPLEYFKIHILFKEKKKFFCNFFLA